MAASSSDFIVDANNEPIVNGFGLSVANFIHRAHEDGVDAVLAPGSPPHSTALSAATFEQILTYCAEQSCTEAGLACNGCRLHSRRAGIARIDDWINQYRSVTLADSDSKISGKGSTDRTIPSLDWLQRNWAGEEYWFWARRVLRKLRYGVRQVDDLTGSAAHLQSAPTVILVEPQIAENIGMVARAMGNFALDELRVINPRDGWPSEKARAVASGAAAIIDDAVIHEHVESAVGDLNWVAATTARQRDMRKPVMTPAAVARELTARISRGEKCGILFGRERNGLQSDEIALADAIVMIPVNNRFASLNLAQSVLLLSYEWLKATGQGSLGRVTTYENPLESGIDLRGNRAATKTELLGLFEHLEGALENEGFFYPSHRRHVVVRNIRTMLTRMAPTDQEVRTMRGIVATLSGRKRKPRNNAE